MRIGVPTILSSLNAQLLPHSLSPLSSFTGTDFHEYLQSKGIKQVVLTGYMAHGEKNSRLLFPPTLLNLPHLYISISVRSWNSSISFGARIWCCSSQGRHWRSKHSFFGWKEYRQCRNSSRSGMHGVVRLLLYCSTFICNQGIKRHSITYIRKIPLSCLVRRSFPSLLSS